VPSLVVLELDEGAEEDLLRALGRHIGDHRQHVDTLGEELDALVDLAQLLLAVDVLGVLGAIALRRRVGDALDHTRTLHAQEAVELLGQALVAFGGDVLAPLHHSLVPAEVPRRRSSAALPKSSTANGRSSMT
jgi:hypothetical protein